MTEVRRMPAAGWRWASWSGEARRELRAVLLAGERVRFGKESGANLRETVTALPAPVTLWRDALFARFAPQLGADEANLLDSAVVVAPPGGKITQELSDALSGATAGCGAGSAVSTTAL